MANTHQVADEILTAITEINQLIISSAERAEFLEQLRPPLQYVCTRIDTHTQSGILTQAQSLQSALALGYQIVIRGILNIAEDMDKLPQELLGLSIHRSISDLSRTILRACQFYSEVSPQIWSHLHQLYELANKLDLANTLYPDEENHSTINTSITDAYLRILLLATARPNQLRQRHLIALFHGLEVWTQYVSLVEPREDTLFLLNPHGNEPPRYKDLVNTVSDNHLDLKTDVLVFELEAYLNELDTKIEVPDYMQPELLGHVIRAWGIMKKRTFRRTTADGDVKVCVGFRTIHYYITGGVDFATQLGSADALMKREINPFSSPQSLDKHATLNDAWDTSSIPLNPKIIDPEGTLLPKNTGLKNISQAEDNILNTYPHFDAQIVDSSPSGYQLQWPDALPANLQTGELLALRDKLDDRWCIAVTRWIRQNNETTLIGVELLSPRAVPIAIRVVKKKGGPTDYSRALLLPALEVIGQPAMLITPLIPFQESQKIHIQRQGIQTTAQLMRRIRITESFSQFTFRMLDGYLENALINMRIGPTGGS
ncbi:MAG: hypothetical protein KUG75_15810 [Pseudomonadales bacterium]|nr:hypothetical protein [Pseudomonadales bacterium]